VDDCRHRLRASRPGYSAERLSDCCPAY
jgi:hypothetical protein